jgi:uncharacterized integral membrane protein
MKALRIIPVLLVLLVCVYLGVLFVEANQQSVVVALGNYRSEPTRMGFVIMTSALIGLLIGAALASVQSFFLYFQNRTLKRKLAQLQSRPTSPGNETA